MRFLFSFIFIISIFSCNTKSDLELTGNELIKKSIEFHDPKDQWKNFKGTLVIQDSLPAGRDSRFYEVSFENNLSKMVYRIEGLHYLVWNDSIQVFEGEIEAERAFRMRNYYTYLWGLPMKLQDPGTQIDDKVTQEELNGKSYLVVRVPYEKDVWYFYLDPQTYAMEAYKFYQDEETKKGEIIYLDGLTEHNGLKIPTNRSWYRTETPEFLGTDMLLEIK
ncbi:hypothetical protein SAMN04488519_102305 [Algoriphagus ornithinivorans]|uniref:Outer membrane lipoprotein-sorting protein n=1 Tax=Algoriphagus ornithinivorans TaxID=226506 RepID=A0A1I5CKU2_9BACT|nr:DUF6503 family protein [Algoriphagus ornithinivorans]SFN87524.1 hypothetical protein SAMN04488519_102305 [Algoriphagus ornithinivorans]